MRDRRIVNDISRRDNGTCSITGLAGTFFDPLVVVPVLPVLPTFQFPLDKVSTCYPLRARPRAFYRYPPLTPVLES